MGDLPRGLCFSIDTLESRTMLSGEPWSDQGHLIAQDLAAMHYPRVNGAGEAIAVIDSGMDYMHPALGGGFGGRAKVVAGWDFDSNSPDPSPKGEFSHATCVAGAAAAYPFVYNGRHFQGIAPNARLIAMRANSTAAIKAALTWILSHRTQYNIVGVCLMPGRPSGYANELKALYDAGVFVGGPAGNDGPNALATAIANEVLIGSVDPNGQVSGLSDRGPNVAMLAPGVQVILPWYSGGQHTYNQSDGTSWAFPQVVGAAALIKQINPRLSVAQVLSILQDSGTKVYDNVSQRTYSVLNLDAAIKLTLQRTSSHGARR